jgi:menaquinone-9 beta-reductase
MSTANTQHYDVIIAAARCAGAATALLLARQGARVLVLDKSRYGTDTLSTHALTSATAARTTSAPCPIRSVDPPSQHRSLYRSRARHMGVDVLLLPIR